MRYWTRDTGCGTRDTDRGPSVAEELWPTQRPASNNDDKIFQAPVSRISHPVSRIAPPSAFTLIELLLALVLASILLLSAATFLWNISEIYFLEKGRPDHDMHARNVTRFIEHIFNNVSQVESEGSANRNNSQEATPIQWATLPGDSLSEKDHLSFQYEKDLAIIYWEDGPLPAITAWLHHEPDEGLFLLWQTTRQAREDPADYMRSLISPHIKEMHFEYYDDSMDEWEEDKDFMEQEKPLPGMIRFLFEWSEDDQHESIILLPAILNGAPLY